MRYRTALSMLSFRRDASARIYACLLSAICLISLAPPSLGAETASPLPKNLPGLCLSIASALASEALPGRTSPSGDWRAEPRNAWPFESGLGRPYDSGLDTASLVLEAGLLALPASLALLGDPSEALPGAAAYVESLAWTFAAKNAAKYLIPKPRPYAYLDAEPDEEAREEAWASFPSGHTALAFSAAASFAVLAKKSIPESPARGWLQAGAFVLAFGEAGLRIASGAHYPSDVLAGALLGGGIGCLVSSVRFYSAAYPHEAAHGGRAAGELSLSALPWGLSLSLRY